MFYLVSYDIPDDRRRTKLAKAVKDFGDRVHYSVFECILSRNLLDKMVARIENIVEDGEDSVRIYALCANCTQAIKIIGTGEVSREEDVYIGCLGTPLINWAHGKNNPTKGKKGQFKMDSAYC